MYCTVLYKFIAFFTQSDPTMIEDPKMRLLGIAVDAMKNIELWEIYFNDFINLKYRTKSDLATDSFESNNSILPIILAYFDFEKISTKDSTSKLAWVHIRSEVKQMDLAQAIDRLTKLHPFITPSDLSVTGSIYSPKTDDLGSFVIQNTYDSLKSILSQWQRVKIDSSVKEWYRAYRDIVSSQYTRAII